MIGDGTDWLRGPADHWVEELVKLARDLRFDAFVAWFDDEDQLAQTERFATDVVPAVREALVGRVAPDHAQDRAIRPPGLTGWRETLADRVASPVADKTPASEDQVRAVIGAAFFLLSVYYVATSLARMAKAARD